MNSVSARHGGKALRSPVFGSLLQPIPAARDEVPGQKARPVERVTADHCQPHWRVGLQHHGFALFEHRHGVAGAGHAVDAQVAIDRVDGPLHGQRRQLEAPAGRQRDVEVQRGREGHHRRSGAEGRADQHTHLRALMHQRRNGFGRCVREAGLHFFVGLRQGAPQLQAVVDVGAVFQMVGLALGMHDAAAGRHPVDGAGADLLHRAQAVAVHHGAVEQVSDGSQADVRMRPHVVLVFGVLGGRPEVVEEDEGADRAVHGGRQQPPDPKAATQVFLVRLQQFHRSFCLSGREGVSQSFSPPLPPRARRAPVRCRGRPWPSRPNWRPMARWPARRRSRPCS